MDLRMPGGDGVTAIARLAADQPRTRVLVLTTYDNDADILRAVEAGAAGYLLKDTTRADLVAAIKAAARGETVLAPAVAGRLMHQLRGPRPEQLTARETEILALVARGRTNLQIGAELFISETTVKTHLIRACAKLGVSGRAAAVAKAIQSGALPARVAPGRPSRGPQRPGRAGPPPPGGGRRAGRRGVGLPDNIWSPPASAGPADLSGGAGQ